MVGRRQDGLLLPLLASLLASASLGLPDATATAGAGSTASNASTVQRVYQDPSLMAKSQAPLFTFYMYRAVGSQSYPPLNVNAANLAGVLWYLHHEVVIQYPRKFSISKIIRYRVQTRAPTPLFQQGMNFGPRGAFDSGKMTGPYVCGRDSSAGPKFCNGTFDAAQHGSKAYSGAQYSGPFEWSKYGFFVGCNKLGDWPYPEFEVDYPGATWYSLPGPCPSETVDGKSAECKLAQPGGFCNSTPTGTYDCTWTYQHMGEVFIDELVGKSSDQLNNEGGREYDPIADKGVRFSFWDGINNATANRARMQALQQLFADRYPNQTLDEEMPSPTCDFKKDDFYREFYWRDPHSGPCQDAKVGDECYRSVMWSMRDGIYGHPEWYPDLSPSSSVKEFQRFLYAQGKCPYRPCDEGEKAVSDVAPGSVGKGNASQPVPAATPAAAAKTVCMNAKPDDACSKAVAFAMQQGIYQHPEWYPNLHPGAGARDFQREMYNNGLPDCPYRPCEDGEKEGAIEEHAAANHTNQTNHTVQAGSQTGQTGQGNHEGAPLANPSATGTASPASGGATAGGASGSDAATIECQDAALGDACYKAVTFAMTSGIFSHPEWYPNLSPKSGFKDFQKAIYNSGSMQCTMPCDDAKPGPKRRLRGR